MSEAIQAIQTIYRGFRFRSRLEARWAIFFDEAGIKWSYEEQGFACEDESYLPDFQFDDWGMFVEIKPTANALFEDFDKIQTVMKKKEGIVIVGNPWPFEYQIFHFMKGIWFPYPTAQFGHCQECNATSCLVSSFDGDQCLWLIKGNCLHTLCWDRHQTNWKDVWHPYRAARQARFEHGETPL